MNYKLVNVTNEHVNLTIVNIKEYLRIFFPHRQTKFFLHGKNIPSTLMGYFNHKKNYLFLGVRIIECNYPI